LCVYPTSTIQSKCGLRIPMLKAVMAENLLGALNKGAKFCSENYWGLGNQPPEKMADYRQIFRLSQDGLQIFFRRFNWHNVELVHQNIKNIGRDKCRQAGPQTDVLYPQIEQG